MTNYDEKNPICSICLSSIKKGINIPICNHAFHKKCLNTWLKQGDSCPLCRREIPDFIYEKSNTRKKRLITKRIRQPWRMHSYMRHGNNLSSADFGPVSRRHRCHHQKQTMYFGRPNQQPNQQSNQQTVRQRLLDFLCN